MANNDNRGFNTVHESNVSRRDQRVRLQRMTLLAIIGIAILMVISVLVLVIGSIASGLDHPTEEDSAPVGGKVVWETATVSAKDTVTGDLVVVNASNKYTFPEDESYLSKVYNVAVKSASSYVDGGADYMETNALSAVDKMLVDMAAATGYKKATLAEAYRTLAQQEGKSLAPGYSDHHTGRLCTINVKDESAKAWLASNAHKYGFVVRYPNAKSDITGVSNYEYAYRYVGVAHATYMYNNNLCLEEYVDYLSANVTNKKPLSVTGADGNTYDIYYYTVGSGASISVPSNYEYTVSGTNKGGVVVTVCRTASQQEVNTAADSAAVTEAQS